MLDADVLIRHALIWLFLAVLPLFAVIGVRRPPLQADLGAPPCRTVASPGSVPGLGSDISRAASPTTEQLTRLPGTPLVEQPWFLAVQQQLRQLGASYVRLEKWHSQPAVYYFECHLESRTVPGDARCHDSAVESQRLAAGRDVRRAPPRAANAATRHLFRGRRPGGSARELAQQPLTFPACWA